jgi:hypothetical protein
LEKEGHDVERVPFGRVQRAVWQSSQGNPFRNRWRPRKIAILKIEEAMTITLKLKPEVEAGLLAQAQASGMTLEDYLLSMVEGAVLPKAQESSSAEERAAAFEAWSAGHRSTPLLSDYAVSREAMYEGRDD